MIRCIPSPFSDAGRGSGHQPHGCLKANEAGRTRCPDHFNWIGNAHPAFSRAHVHRNALRPGGTPSLRFVRCRDSRRRARERFWRPRRGPWRQLQDSSRSSLGLVGARAVDTKEPLPGRVPNPAFFAPAQRRPRSWHHYGRLIAGARLTQVLTAGRRIARAPRNRRRRLRGGASRRASDLTSPRPSPTRTIRARRCRCRVCARGVWVANRRCRARARLLSPRAVHYARLAAVARLPQVIAAGCPTRRHRNRRGNSRRVSICPARCRHRAGFEKASRYFLYFGRAARLPFS